MYSTPLVSVTAPSEFMRDLSLESTDMGLSICASADYAQHRL